MRVDSIVEVIAVRQLFLIDKPRSRPRFSALPASRQSFGVSEAKANLL
jgi:hypothetical protein